MGPSRTSRIAVIDLFAGAGGLSVGAVAAGGDVRLAVDSDDVCEETLKANREAHTKVIRADLTLMAGADLRRLGKIGRKDSLVIVGGPPCQPFSKASYWTDPGDESRYRRARAAGKKATKPASPPPVKPDPRRDLIATFWNLVLDSKADAFVFENVPSLGHPRHRHILEWLIEEAERNRFLTAHGLVKAVRYGVPQKRERIFVLGVRGAKPELPAPSHAEDRPVTAGRAIRTYRARKYFEPEEVVKGRWAHLLPGIPPGWNYKAHTEWGGSSAPVFVTETRFWHFLLKLSPDLPSWTIPANPGPWTGPFHWDNRRLRTVELAALQGFPDGYIFCGNRRERVRQIGNAVPPILAARMVQEVLAAMGAGTESSAA